MRGSGKGAGCQPGRGASAGAKSASTMTLHFPCSRAVRNEHPQSGPPSRGHWVAAAQARRARQHPQGVRPAGGCRSRVRRGVPSCLSPCLASFPGHLSCVSRMHSPALSRPPGFPPAPGPPEGAAWSHLPASEVGGQRSGWRAETLQQRPYFSQGLRGGSPGMRGPGVKETRAGGWGTPGCPGLTG